MVAHLRKSGFFAERDGIALTEGLVTIPIMILAISVCIEFGYLLHQWNLGAKAMHLGVRKLVVSEPVTPDFQTVFAFDPAQGGSLITANAGVSSSCGAGTGAACDGNMMNRLVNGTPGNNSVWPGLAAYFPGLQVADIRVSYELSGLGYQGRPTGPIVTVRMQLQRDATDLPFTGALLNLAGITFPPFVVTATSEDLRSCPDGCGPAG